MKPESERDGERIREIEAMGFAAKQSKAIRTQNVCHELINRTISENFLSSFRLMGQTIKHTHLLTSSRCPHTHTYKVQVSLLFH